MKKILKEEAGIVSADAVIAILVITLFIGLIATVSYNIYLASTSTKRNAEATQYMINFFEKVDGMNYNGVDQVAVDSIISELDAPEGYTITSEVGNPLIEQQTQDLIKTVKLIIEYKVGGREQKIEANHIKAKEQS